jgi:4-aminobutyrate aminotransferase
MANIQEAFAHVSPVWSRITPLVVERGEGCYLYTPEGTRYLDFTCGIEWTAEYLPAT